MITKRIPPIRNCHPVVTDPVLLINSYKPQITQSVPIISNNVHARLVTLAPEKVPAYLTLSNFFAGADKNLEGDQAFSTYAELGTHYDFLDEHQLSLAVGMAFNESCYNGYEHGFGVCNIELKYTYNVKFNEKFTLPLSAAYIVNPVYTKSHVNFTASFAF